MKAGFSDVTFTDSGYAGVEWEGCSRGDNAYFKASAKNPAGKRVSGVLVCCGQLKACTIRF